ncbi:AAA family ATPase (plasmid) [Paracoccus sp. TK19116]|uniref:AAA family ATPase n=2 Tax=Paracoccus albicereus TaxID=2922394 RepID=A0ABT1MKL2_9RHOB|nr:AAA family ATPase [Paracoccus albicereus]
MRRLRLYIPGQHRAKPIPVGVTLWRRMSHWTEPRQIVILTGASGAGKTTIARLCGEMAEGPTVFHFDNHRIPDGGVPHTDYTDKVAWQHHMVTIWLRWLKDHDAALILLEGQMLLPRLIEVLREEDLRNVTVILVECADAERAKRLSGRGHAHLIGAGLDNRVLQFRADAEALGIPVFLTDDLQGDALAQLVNDRFDRSPLRRLGRAVGRLRQGVRRRIQAVLLGLPLAEAEALLPLAMA